MSRKETDELDPLNEAYHEGRAASFDCEGFDNCPYPTKSAKWQSWRRGYLDEFSRQPQTSNNE